MPREVEGVLGRVAQRVHLRLGDTGLVGEVRAPHVAARVGRRVLDAVGDADPEEERGPAHLLGARRAVADALAVGGGEARVVGRQRVGQVVPRDDRDDRVDARVDAGDGELHLTAVRAADHADARVVLPVPTVVRDAVVADVGDPAAVVGPLAAAEVGHQLLRRLAVPVGVVEGDLAVGAAEAETGVREHDVPALREGATEVGLVVLGAAEAVRGEDRRLAVRSGGGRRPVEVVDDGADLPVACGADGHVDALAAHRHGGGRLGRPGGSGGEAGDERGGQGCGAEDGGTGLAHGAASEVVGSPGSTAARRCGYAPVPRP